MQLFYVSSVIMDLEKYARTWVSMDMVERQCMEDAQNIQLCLQILLPINQGHK